MATSLTENSVASLCETPFNRRLDVDKKRVKDLGPDRPDLNIQQQTTDSTRSFSSSLYARRSWLAGCSLSDAFFCFPCLLFQSPGTETIWTATGVRHPQ